MAQVYASFFERLRSSLYDACLWLGWTILLVFLPWPEVIPGGVRAALWILPALCAEPLLVSKRGASVGQALRGLRVEPRPGRSMPTLPLLFLRHLLKLACGGFSVLYVPFAPRAEAIHDRLFGTVVVHAGAQQPEQPPLPAAGSLRRLFWAIAWVLGSSVVASITLGALLAVFFPEALETRGDEGEVVNAVISILLILIEAPVLALAFGGRLPGTRPPTKRADAEAAA